MNAALLTLVFAATGPSLSIEASAQELLQYDHVVVKCVLRNTGDLSVTIDRRGGLLSDAIQVQELVGGEWKSLPSMEDQIGVPVIGLTPDPILESGSELAHFKCLFLTQTGFVFSSPAVIELRAVAQCSGTRIESEPLKIVVKKRQEQALVRIRDAVKDSPVEFTPGMSVDDKRRMVIESKRRGKFSCLGATWFDGTVGKNLVEIADIGGNLGKGVARLQLLSRLLNGTEPTGDDVIGYVRQEFDNPVDVEVALHVLGSQYQRHGDWTNLEKIFEALPDRSAEAYEWEAQVARRLIRVPRVVVQDGED